MALRKCTHIHTKNKGQCEKKTQQQANEVHTLPLKEGRSNEVMHESCYIFVARSMLVIFIVIGLI